MVKRWYLGFLVPALSGCRCCVARINATGGSMGGWLSAMLCTTSDLDTFNDDGEYREQSSAVQAACSWNGSTDWRSIHHERQYHAACFSNEWAFDETDDDYGVYLTKGDLRIAEQASPITYVSRGDPPILLMTGFCDVVVPPYQHHALYTRLCNVGVDAQIRIIAGGQHFGPAMINAGTRAMAADFFDKHLSP